MALFFKFELSASAGHFTSLFARYFERAERKKDGFAPAHESGEGDEVSYCIV